MKVNPSRLARVSATRPTAIGRLLLLARRDFVVRVSRCMQARGLQEFPANFLTLLPDIDTEGTRSTELAQRAGISKQAVAKTIRLIEGAGLLLRTPDAEDGRAWLVRLSEKGLELLLQTHRAIDEVEREYERMLGVRGMQAFRAALHQLAYGEPPQAPVLRRAKRAAEPAKGRAPQRKTGRAASPSQARRPRKEHP